MDFYNQTSKSYNELHGEEQLKKLSIIKNNIKINKNDLLLDVGCGTGISSQFNCRVTGIDNSFQLLKINKSKCKILNNAENLPFKNNIFDYVVSITSIHNFRNIEKALEEMKKVGKNKFVFSILKKSNKLKKIKNLIKKHFKVNKIIEEDKDLIFFAQ